MSNFAPLLFQPGSVPDIEARLRAAGVTVDEFCREVGIDRSTWTRWKQGVQEPRMKVWRRVVAALPAGQGATP